MNRILLACSMLCILQCSIAQIKIQDSASSDESIANMLQSIDGRLMELEKASIGPNKAFGENLQVGLSFGFNAFTNGPKSFYIKEDSTIGEYGKSNGVSGMLSALLGYQLTNKHTIYLNIPLSDFTSTPSQAIGVFNKKIAGGLGYGYSINKISLIAVVNMFPYESVAVEILSERKFSEEAFTLLNVADLPTISKVSPSLTIGICYNLLRPRDATLIAPN